MLRKLFLETEGTSGVDYLFMVLFIIIAGVLIFFLYKSVRRERNRSISEKLKMTQMNKASFDEMLEHRFKSANKKTHFSVFFVKLTNGANLAVTYGDKQYEEILAVLLKRLNDVIPKGSKACVYTEDILGVYITENFDSKALSDVITFSLMELKKPIELVTKARVRVTFAIGAALFDYATKTTVLDFIANIQTSLKSAMEAGENKFVIYNPVLEFVDDESYQFFNTMQVAVATKEYQFGYQPIYDISGEDKIPIAYNAVLCWTNKNGQTEKCDDKFITVLEQSGELPKVTPKMVEALERAVQMYKQTHPVYSTELRFAICVSEKQLQLQEFPNDLYKAVKRSRLAVSDVCIEVPEFRNPNVVKNVEKLLELGFRISANLENSMFIGSYLRNFDNFACEWVKVSKSIFTESTTDFYLKGTLDLLTKFTNGKNIKFVVSGIETVEDTEMLKDNIIRYAQGVYYQDIQSNIE